MDPSGSVLPTTSPVPRHAPTPGRSSEAERRRWRLSTRTGCAANWAQAYTLTPGPGIAGAWAIDLESAAMGIGVTRIQAFDPQFWGNRSLASNRRGVFRRTGRPPLSFV